MTEYVMNGSRYVYRDEDDVLHIHRRGDRVELTREQEQRHRAGQPGSMFQREGEDEQPETVEIAVANEATKPAEDGSPPASAAGTRNRRAPVSSTPRRERGEAGDTQAREPVASPATSTETKSAESPQRSGTSGQHRDDKK